MTIIPQDWHKKAIDDGEAFVNANEYSVELTSVNGQTYTTHAAQVRGNPQVSAANAWTISVPPADFLQDERFLGANAVVYVDGDYLTEGEVKKITSNQREEGDYDLKIHSQGRKLLGDTLEKDIDNEVASDAIANIVDNYNRVDSRHSDKVSTTDESLTNIVDLGGEVKGVVSTSSSGTATYSNVGPDASDLDIIYAKVYADSNGVTLTVDDSTNTDSKTVTNLDKNQYGEWFSFVPSGLDSTQYSLEFTLNGSSKLIDWVAIQDQTHSRKVHTPDVSKTDSGVNIYSRSGSTLQDEQTGVNDVGAVYDANVGSSGGWRARHQTEWYNMNDSTDTGKLSDSDATGGAAHPLFTGSLEVGDTFNTEDTFEQWGLYGRVKWRPRIYAYEDFSDWTQNNSTVTSPVYEGSTAVHKTSTTEESDSFRDVDIANIGFVFKSQIYIPSSPNGGHVEIVLDGTGSGEEIFGRIDFAGGIEIWDDTGQLATASYSVPTGTWLDCELWVRPGPSELEFIVEGTSTGKVDPGTSATQIDFARIRDGECYFDALLGKLQDSLDRDIGPKYSVTINGNNFQYGAGSLDNAPHKYEWDTIAEYGHTSNWPDNLDSPDIKVQLWDGDASPFISVDCLTLVHEEPNWSEGSFDNTLTNGFLNYPHRYDTGEVEFSAFIDDENIDLATTSGTMNNTTNPVSSWGPVQRVDKNTPYPGEYPDSTSTSTNFAYPGVSHATKWQLCATGATRDTNNPRNGYNRMELEGYSVTGDHNNLDVMYGRRISDNRLGAISTLSDRTTAYFRWEGDRCVIFQRGLLTTDPDLLAANITSTVSIEGVYKSCEVIGLHDVRSGVISATSPPSYVDDHKEIRDEGIETEADAVSRAKAFLQENGAVQYEGNIDLDIPTLAPLGSEIDGQHFNHGQSMIIKRVRYNSTGTSIELGLKKDVVTEFVRLSTDTHDTKSRETGPGLRIPSGSDSSA